MEPEAVMQSETIQSNLHVSHMKRLTEYIGILVIQYQARKAQVLHFTACLPLLLFAWFTTLHARVAVKIKEVYCRVQIRPLIYVVAIAIIWTLPIRFAVAFGIDKVQLSNLAR